MSGRVETPAFYEERLRLLEAERQQLRDALEEIVSAPDMWPEELGGYALDIARGALDGTPSAAQTLEEPQTTRGTGSS